MGEKEDPIITARKKVMKLIENHKDDELKYAFLNLYDLEVKKFRMLLEEHRNKSTKACESEEKRWVKLNKLEQKIHDNDIEQKYHIQNISKESIQKLNTFQKAVTVKPRLYGLCLFIFGKMMIESAKKMDRDKI